MAKYYAVRKGKKPGIYNTWAECKEQVNGFSGAVYKSFESLAEAQAFIDSESKKEIPENSPYAYVDGSYNQETGVYGFGGNLYINGKEIPITGSGNDPEMAGMRNVAGEILGATKAIELAIDEGAESIVIYYDYVGIEKWATGEWKANKYGTMEYKNFIEIAKPLIDIHFVKVKAHTGVEENEKADRMAKKAVGIVENSNDKIQQHSQISQQNEENDIGVSAENVDFSYDEERFYVYSGPNLPDDCPVPKSIFLKREDVRGEFPNTYRIIVGVDSDNNGRTERKSFLKTDKEFGETVYLDELIGAGCVYSFPRLSAQGQNETAYFLKYDLISE